MEDATACTSPLKRTRYACVQCQSTGMYEGWKGPLALLLIMMKKRNSLEAEGVGPGQGFATPGSRAGRGEGLLVGDVLHAHILWETCTRLSSHRIRPVCLKYPNVTLWLPMSMPLFSLRYMSVRAPEVAVRLTPRCSGPHCTALHGAVMETVVIEGAYRQTRAWPITYILTHVAVGRRPLQGAHSSVEMTKAQCSSCPVGDGPVPVLRNSSKLFRCGGRQNSMHTFRVATCMYDNLPCDETTCAHAAKCMSKNGAWGGIAGAVLRQNLYGVLFKVGV